MNTDRRDVTNFKLMTLLGLAIFLNGCLMPHELAQSGQVSLVAIDGRTLKVDKPTVWQEDKDLVVSGTVTRKFASSGLGPSQVYVTILGPDNQLLTQVEVPIRPWPIPVSEPRSSSYRATLEWSLKAGQTIQVSLNPEQTMKR